MSAEASKASPMAAKTQIPRLLKDAGLDRFGRNREPVFFQHVHGFIDKFHAGNHRACSDAFEATLFPDLRPGKVDTEICEQVNAHFVRLKSHFVGMSQATFMFNLIQYVTFFNYDKWIKMQFGNKRNISYCHSVS